MRIKVDVHVFSQNTGSAKRLWIALRKNNTDVINMLSYGDYSTVDGSIIIDIASGDTLSLYHKDANTVAINSGAGSVDSHIIIAEL